MAARAPRTRSRILAMWFVSLLILSVMPAFVPTAEAGHTIEIQTFTVTATKYGSSVDTITNNTQVTFTVTGTYAQCRIPTTSTDPSVTVTVDAQILGYSATLGVPSASSSNTFSASVTVPVTSHAAAVNNAAATFIAKATATCDQSAHIPSDHEESTDLVPTDEKTSQPIPVYLRPPQVTFEAIIDTSTAEASFGQTIAGIQSKVHVWVNNTNTAPFTGGVPSGGSASFIRFDGTNLNFNPVNLATNGNVSFTFPVNETSPGFTGLRAVNLVAKDVGDNYRNHTLPIEADTIRPTSAVSGLTLRVENNGTDTLKVVPTWTPTADATRIQLTSATGTGIGRNLHQTHVPASASTSSLSIRPVDQAGNIGTASSTSTIQLPRITPAVYHAPLSLPSIVSATGIGNVDFTLHGPQPNAATFNSDVTVTLFRVGKGYWNGGTATADAAYTSAATAARFRPAADTTGPTITLTNFSEVPFPDGLYVFNYTMNASTGDIVHRNAWLQVDRLAPQVPTFTVQTPGAAIHGADGNPMNLRVNFSEGRSADTGIKNVTVEVTTIGFGSVVKNAMGTDARHDFPWASFLTARQPAPATGGIVTNPAWTANDTGFDGWLNLTFPGLPVGDYQVRLVLTDKAGNVRTNNVPDVYKVRPRVSIVANPAPHVDETGVTIVGLAAHESATAPSGFTCDSPSLCPVGNVTIYGRNIGGAAHRLAIITSPSGTGAQDGLSYYSYSPTTKLPLEGLDPTKHVEVWVEGWVTIGGIHYVAESPKIRAQTPDAPTLEITSPARAGEQKDWYLNTTGTVKLNATFQLRLSSDVPQLNYTLSRPATGEEWNNTLPTQDLNPAHANYTIDLKNGTNDLASGEYKLHVQARSSSNELWDFGERWFAVQREAPAVTFPAQQKDTRIATHLTEAAFYTAPTFEIEVKLAHGVANMTDLSQLKYQMRRAEAFGNQELILSPGSAGFTVSATNRTPLVPHADETTVLLTVTLPTGAVSGQRFILNVTLESDAKNTPGTPYAAYAGAGFATLILDDAKPDVVGTFIDPTENTGALRDGNLKIFGAAGDLQSGIGRIDVRIVDLDNEKTFVGYGPHRNTFRPGILDEWLLSNETLVETGSSTTRRYVNFTEAAGTVGWEIEASNWKFPIDQHTRYQIDVRAYDRVGLSSDVNSTIIRFDPEAPKLLTTTNGSVTAPTTIKWQSKNLDGSTVNTIFNTSVSDNVCVAKVSLVGIAPSGAAIGPVPFKAPAAAACSHADAHKPQNWTFNVKDHPLVANEVGHHQYWIVAEDRVGRVSASTTRVHVNVTDTLPASIHFAHPLPPVAQAGGSAQVHFQVSENDRLERVEVVMSRSVTASSRIYINPDGSRPMNPDLSIAAPARFDAASPPAANGTGAYFVDVAEDFNYTLEVGEYLFEIRARDVNLTGCNPACPQTNVIVVVVSDAAPFIQKDAPGNAVEWLNATPTFRFRVFDPSTLSSGVVVEAGANASQLAVANASLTETFSAGNSTGWTVVYSPTLENVTEWHVRVRATDTTGFTNTTPVFSYKVDLELPMIEVNVTGTREGPDNVSYAVQSTRIALNATDELSGLGGITYRENNGEERTYSTPIAPSGPDGNYTLTVSARDVAGNVNTSTLEMRIDTSGPTIRIIQHGDTVTATVTDAGVGVDEDNVTVRYAYGDATSFASARMTKVTENTFRATLPGNASETGLRYFFEARDLFGNVGTNFTSSAPHVIQAQTDAPVNLPPTISITAPVANSTVGRSVELLWTAVDPEGESLTVTIARRDPIGPGAVLVPAGENTGSYTWSTADLAPGTYTLVVTVSDGVHNAQASVAVQVRAFIGDVTRPPSSVTMGQAATFSVQLNPGERTIQNVTFSIVRDGQQVADGGMTLLGDNVYAGSFTPQQAGNYRVLVQTQFSDGSSADEAEIGTFEVASLEAPPRDGVSFPGSLITLLVLGIMTVALAAYGAFGRWPR